MILPAAVRGFIKHNSSFNSNLWFYIVIFYLPLLFVEATADLSPETSDNLHFLFLCDYSTICWTCFSCIYLQLYSAVFLVKGVVCIESLIHLLSFKQKIEEIK